MLSSIQLKYDEINQSNISYKTELGKLRTKNENLSKELMLKVDLMSALHHKLKELDTLHGVMVSVTLAVRSL